MRVLLSRALCSADAYVRSFAQPCKLFVCRSLPPFPLLWASPFSSVVIPVFPSPLASALVTQCDLASARCGVCFHSNRPSIVRFSLWVPALLRGHSSGALSLCIPATPRLRSLRSVSVIYWKKNYRVQDRVLQRRFAKTGRPLASSLESGTQLSSRACG